MGSTTQTFSFYDMNRQTYRRHLRDIDKQLAIWDKYANRLTLARVNAPTEKLRLEAETSLMVLSQQVYKLLNKRKDLVMFMESTRQKEARPSDAQEDIPLYPMGEQIF